MNTDQSQVEMSDGERNRPNLLWYCSAQQRFDTIGALNNPHVHTPRLDQFMQEAVTFDTVYCLSPICTPVGPVS